MAENSPIFVTIHSFTSQGQHLLGDRWMSLFYTLRTHLQQSGQEVAESHEELLLYSFNHLWSAFTSVFACIDQVKQEFQWDAALGGLPLQVVFHLENEHDLPHPFQEPASNLWDLLAPETPYISRSLRLQWERLTEGDKLPPHHFEEEKMGLYQVKFLDKSPLKREILFPHRRLPLQGDFKKCFYCGMTSHKPASCPGKLLNMQTQGLPFVGYLPIAQLGELFQEAFADQERLVNILAAGVTASQLRKHLSLQVYVAYFDLAKVYQPRFLWNIAFSLHSKWDDLGKPETVTVDSHSLHLGLDCLRVGQYAQAEELFVDESRRPRGKQLYATIGRAFVALELEREHDMGHYLESALRMATTDKERIYIDLLLSRFYALQDNAWKAEHSLDGIFSLERDCTEALYRQVQLSVREGFGDKALRQLRSLVAGQKEFFMQALMDPQLIPIQTPIEDILASRLESQQHDAEENLGKARLLCQELQAWLAEDEKEMQTLHNDLVDIEKQYGHKSYYDMIDVAEKSAMLVRACYRVQEAKLDALKEKIDMAIRKWESSRNFWVSYPYPALFKDFHTILSEIKEQLSEVQAAAEKNMHGKLYRSLLEVLEQVSEKFNTLRQMSVKMSWVRVMLDGVKLFGKKLIITEVVLLSLGLLLVPGLAFLLSDTASAGFISLLRDPWFQKQALFVITILAAPLLALAQTLWSITET